MEIWKQGGDKKPIFEIQDRDGVQIPLANLSGYGVIIYYPDGTEVGRFGVGIEGFDDTKVSTVAGGYRFQVSLDKELNSQDGIYKYHLAATWIDASFDDSNYDDFTPVQIPIFKSSGLEV